MGKFDEFFDDVVVNTKAAATAISKKASAIYDNSKHKISAAEIRSEINKKLRDLGALTYKAKVQNQDLSDEVIALVDEITELKYSLSVINAHINSAKSSKKCPNCDANVPKNSLFCNICGAKIDEEEAEESEQAQQTAEEVQEAETAAEDVAEEVIETEDDTVDDNDETVGI